MFVSPSSYEDLVRQISALLNRDTSNTINVFEPQNRRARQAQTKGRRGAQVWHNSCSWLRFAARHEADYASRYGC